MAAAATDAAATERVVVITGGTGGIGLHSATACAKAGARVIVTGRDAARGRAAPSKKAPRVPRLKIFRHFRTFRTFRAFRTFSDVFERFRAFSSGFGRLVSEIY